MAKPKLPFPVGTRVTVKFPGRVPPIDPVNGAIHKDSIPTRIVVEGDGPHEWVVIHDSYLDDGTMELSKCK